MGNGCGREKNSMARGKLNDKLRLPEDNVPAELVLEAAERGHATPAEWDIGEVAVASGHRRGATVERGGGPDAAVIVPFQLPMVL